MVTVQDAKSLRCMANDVECRRVNPSLKNPASRFRRWCRERLPAHWPPHDDDLVTLNRKCAFVWASLAAGKWVVTICEAAKLNLEGDMTTPAQVSQKASEIHLHLSPAVLREVRVLSRCSMTFAADDGRVNLAEVVRCESRPDGLRDQLLPLVNCGRKLRILVAVERN